MSRLNEYSKWDTLELSDDDTEDLPASIDKDSFKKYTKSKRLQRDESEAAQISELKKSIASAENELKQLGAAGRNHKKGLLLQAKLEKETKELEKLEVKVSKRLNADNVIGKEVFSGGNVDSMSESTAPKIDGNVDVEKFEDFSKKHEKILTKFVDELSEQALFKSTAFLLEHPEVLLSSDGETFCLFHCLGLEMEGETKRMEKSARQQQLVYQSLNLSRAMRGLKPGEEHQNPDQKITIDRKATEQMLAKLEDDPELQASFKQQVEDFIKKIKIRAQEKIKEEKEEEEAASKLVEESKTTQKKAAYEISKDADTQGGGTSSTSPGKKSTSPKTGTQGASSGKKKEPADGKTHYGPGGLNAQEVFDTLPTELQEAFIEKDAMRLQAAFAKLGSEANTVMQKCVAGGLWVMPGGDDGRESEDSISD